MFTRCIKFARRPGVIALVVVAGAGLALLGGGYAALSVWPAIGAQGADVLRGLIGDEAVAKLETAVLQFQDAVHGWEYQVSGAQPAAPWAATSAGEASVIQPSSPEQAQKATLKPLPLATPGPSDIWPTLSHSSMWTLAPLQPLGSIPGEGQWSPYLQDASGRTVAYRTFLQPDPQRPYAVVAVVAFDLNATRLHFVLGTEEPRSPVAVERPGRIPASDFKPGWLLAAFNGGFKAEHGHFGAMVGGVTVLPPRAGLGTVAIYDDGRVRIGAWGTEVTTAPNILAWRQNGPLIVHDGQINPHTADYAPKDWGYTVKGVTATWRSGLGVSADERTLFYVAGRSLTLPALAQALAAAGAYQAMQLDINDYWVHFDAIQPGGAGLQAVPLIESMKYQSDNRYLKGFKRDFFYLTAHAG